MATNKLVYSIAEGSRKSSRIYQLMQRGSGRNLPQINQEDAWDLEADAYTFIDRLLDDDHVDHRRFLMREIKMRALGLYLHTFTVSIERVGRGG